MGFDAPRGKGDDRNRERITIVADGNGGAYIRFLDRRTRVPARLFLDEDNRVWLEFNDAQEQQIVRRRFGFSGEEKLQEPRGALRQTDTLTARSRVCARLNSSGKSVQQTGRGITRTVGLDSSRPIRRVLLA
jgi:hypothetical protein